eukprot:3607910-Pyramimonas_sp.AAC.1
MPTLVWGTNSPRWWGLSEALRKIVMGSFFMLCYVRHVWPPSPPCPLRPRLHTHTCTTPGPSIAST